jgi:hypothetical protein
MKMAVASYLQLLLEGCRREEEEVGKGPTQASKQLKRNWERV